MLTSRYHGFTALLSAVFYRGAANISNNIQYIILHKTAYRSSSFVAVRCCTDGYGRGPYPSVQHLTATNEKLNSKSAVAHDLLTIDLYSAVGGDNVYVNGSIP